MIKQLTAILIAAAAFPASHCFAGEVLTVNLRDGGQLHGDIHVQTNDQHLWLRMSAGSTVVVRPIDWAQISCAQHGKQTLTTDQLQAVAPKWKTVATPRRVVPTAPVTGKSYAERALEALGFTTAD
ncbi:MAG: hypothetical protein QGG36_30950 [Pirellulaceae bacterium]|jgi:hypothetical protein|nr:hypothetical protein [Pirellulaceae bacterium]MDP7020256.1 hypothetical protein [Pirellulaceae bacterium]